LPSIKPPGGIVPPDVGFSRAENHLVFRAMDGRRRLAPHTNVGKPYTMKFWRFYGLANSLKRNKKTYLARFLLIGRR
jgi:hypothetical protein